MAEVFDFEIGNVVGPQGPQGPQGEPGVVEPAAAVVDLPTTAELADVITQFNTLLANLRAAGLLTE